MPIYDRTLNFPEDSKGFIDGLIDIHNRYEYFDLQLRRGNWIYFYYGRYAILQIQISGANTNYNNDDWFLGGRARPVGRDVAAIEAYLIATAQYISANEANGDKAHVCYDTKLEEYWEHKTSKNFSLTPFPGTDMFMFDRQAVLEFNNMPERDAFYNIATQPFQNLLQEFPNANDNLNRRTDLLAVSTSGDLWVIEAKHGRNFNGIMTAPLQVAIYQNAFINALPDIRSQINALAEQKRSLGLLSAATTDIRAGAPVKSALLIAGQLPSERSMEGLSRLVDRLPETSRPSAYLYYSTRAAFSATNINDFLRLLYP